MEPAIDASAVVLLLLDSTTADLKATAPPESGATTPGPASPEGHGLDFYA